MVHRPARRLLVVGCVLLAGILASVGATVVATGGAELRAAARSRSDQPSLSTSLVPRRSTGGARSPSRREPLAVPERVADVEPDPVLADVVPVPDATVGAGVAELVLAGRVLSPEGNAIARALVEVRQSSRGAQPHMHAREVVECDASGRFRVDGLLPLRTTLVARGSGWVDSSEQVIDVMTPEARADIELRLRAGGVLAGTVSGAPAGRKVDVLAVRGDVHRSVLTSAAGRFAVEDLPPGEYDVLVEPTSEELRGSAPADHGAVEVLTLRSSALVAEGAVAEVRLHASGVVPLVLVGSARAGGLPLARARIEASLADGPDLGFRSRADDRGGFVLTVPGPGRYELCVASADEHVRYAVELALDGRTRAPLDVSYEVGALSGCVVGSQGPVAGIRVEARARLGRARAEAETSTREDGTFLFRALPCGSYTVVAETDSSAFCAPDPRPVFATAASTPVGVQPGRGAVVAPLVLEEASWVVIEGEALDDVRGFDALGTLHDAAHYPEHGFHLLGPLRRGAYELVCASGGRELRRPFAISGPLSERVVVPLDRSSASR